jgi:hypothetical protein
MPGEDDAHRKGLKALAIPPGFGFLDELQEISELELVAGRRRLEAGRLEQGHGILDSLSSTTQSLLDCATGYVSYDR